MEVGRAYHRIRPNHFGRVQTIHFWKRFPLVVRLTLAIAAIALVRPDTGPRPAGPPPNVVVVLADDLGFGDLASYGATQIPTPHTDRLAAEGARFTDAHTSGGVCHPSRYALLTGRHSWRSPQAMAAFAERGLFGFMPQMVEDERTTLPEALRVAGYATYAVGKWHLGMDWATVDGARAERGGANVDYGAPVAGGPLDHGFDRWFGIAASLDQPPYVFVRDRRPVADAPVGRTEPGRAPGRAAADWDDAAVGPAFTEAAVEYLEEHVERRPGDPFFLYVALSAPHTPYAPAPVVQGASAAGPRGDLVAEVDWSVGQILDALDRLGLAENTVVVVTSDNGAVTTGVPAWRVDPRAHGIEDYGHAPNGYLRGQKGSAWEGGHRVPLLVRWPARVPAGATEGAVVSLVDLFATFADAAGVAVPGGAAEDSRSFLPVLTGEAEASRRGFVHHAYHEDLYALRLDSLKYIDGQDSGGFMGPYRPQAADDADGWPFRPAPDPDRPPAQLYNVLRDPSETENLYDVWPAEVARLRAELARRRAGADTL